ncbi:unnamed protein product [Larinioides sclopetarius]|uniref:Uncharacterized protein n=1 Tax=Larinioides sclopetarius TaxID=280406 RepID=A0AAV1ZKS0_9ARAC
MFLSVLVIGIMLVIGQELDARYKYLLQNSTKRSLWIVNLDILLAKATFREHIWIIFN